MTFDAEAWPILGPLVEPGRREEISRKYGPEILTALLVATVAKPILILRGPPGVGKSELALGLIDDKDDKRTERSMVVTVSSTWRGKEDLLGHINPVNNLFEPTRFTDFLRKAAMAWDKGDTRPRLVVFEEFNISQPEFWLSEILARSQYPASAKQNRTIELGGQGVRGWPVNAKPQVYLSPAVRFVATINSDHTTRPLSPRALDRAAVVELGVTPRDAIARFGLELDHNLVEAIAELDFRTRRKGATFSFRTARSLLACFESREEMGLEQSTIVDLVLVQEMLSKVRLLASDPADRNLIDDLFEWANGPGRTLFECGRVVATWREQLDAGQDVMPV